MFDDQSASGQGTQEPAQIVARSSLVTINWGQHSDLDPITAYKYVTLPHNIHAISNIHFLSSVVFVGSDHLLSAKQTYMS